MKSQINEIQYYIHLIDFMALAWHNINLLKLSGLCLGDSGGPLFKTYQLEDNSRMSVLIGIVSRGTGSRGNCGGLDNATHYVRIKDFLDWIMVSNEKYIVENKH